MRETEPRIVVVCGEVTHWARENWTFFLFSLSSRKIIGIVFWKYLGREITLNKQQVAFLAGLKSAIQIICPAVHSLTMMLKKPPPNTNKTQQQKNLPLILVGEIYPIAENRSGFR